MKLTKRRGMCVEFRKNVRENQNLRDSFNQLAEDTFGIHFGQWHARGYWTEKYVPFSYIEGDRVIANVSVNLIDFTIAGEEKKAIQIGTVMTHPDYRNRGLSKDLLMKVLDEYRDHVDFVYLFANQNVLELYPKFGFQAQEETLFTMVPGTAGEVSERKLDMEEKADRDLAYGIARDRLPVSTRFGTRNTGELFMFYALYAFPDNLYYLEEEEAVVMFQRGGERLDLFDVACRETVDVRKIAEKLAGDDTRQIVFHFTPEETEGMQADVFHGDDVLFVLPMKSGVGIPDGVKHPLTAQA
ncbi:GNAT family N-acetyltransferase [Rossellomorea marisflavi]|uniref:GNAT family N-acetyltransferase n=1 Tax=Rossellomorea marisflavi TaxID=189381 RepID=UPI0025B1FEF3|nr:GNAT family N-acetyltransferase [Rossellomorea marisflavi]MDW4525537.1 GNAT family N-acetyltransferase [Rossellomorea marisflavi]WJV18023.1 GNAT family N-acetyltransferase [Rossellomorea marisflavi]